MASSDATAAPAISNDHIELIKQLLTQFDAWLPLGDFSPLVTPITGGYSSSMYKVALPQSIIDSDAFAASSSTSSIPVAVVARIYRPGSDAESLQRPSRELEGLGIVSHIYVCLKDAHLEEFIGGGATGTCGQEPFTLSEEVTIGTVVALAKLHRELTQKWKLHEGNKRMSPEESWASGRRIIGPHPIEAFVSMLPDESLLPLEWQNSPDRDLRLDVPLTWATQFMELKAETCASVEGWTPEVVRKASEAFHKCAEKCKGFPTVLCHNDAHAANVMQRENEALVLVDLETITWNFAAYDVATVIVRRGLESGGAQIVPDDEFLRRVVSAYLKEHPIASLEAFLYQVRFCCVLAWWTKIVWSFLACLFMGVEIPMVKAIPRELQGLVAYASSLL